MADCRWLVHSEPPTPTLFSLFSFYFFFFAAPPSTGMLGRSNNVQRGIDYYYGANDAIPTMILWFELNLSPLFPKPFLRWCSIELLGD